MKRLCVCFLALWLVVSLASCQKQKEWRGFEEEDLSYYLTVGDYRGLTYAPANTAVSAEEIDAALQARLSSLVEWQETENPIAEGSKVLIDRFCFVDGVSTPSLSEEGGSYICGESDDDPAIRGLLPQLLGKGKGDTAEYQVILPAGYLSADSPEREVTYRVTVRAVYEQEVPLLTDALAPSLVSGCQSIEECRTYLENEIKSSKQTKENDRIENELRTALMVGVTLHDLPYDLYEEAYTEAYASYEMLALASSISLEDYAVSYLGISKSELEDLLDERVRAELTERLTLHAVAKAEGISVTERELRAYAEREAVASQGMFANGDEYLDYFGTEQVTEDYLWEKVMAVLLVYAVPQAST